MKKTSKFTAILIFLLSSSFFAFSQKSTTAVIITIVKNNNVKLDGFGYTQWIIPIDSLSKLQFDNNSIFPLLIQDYSIDNLKDCMQNRPIAPFSYTTGTNFNFPDSVSKKLVNISNLIDNKKQSIQIIKKKWGNGYKEKVRVYATPIKGEFCFCKTHAINYEYFGDTKYIVLGFNNINYFPEFWSTETAKNLRNIDFSMKNKFSQMWK